MNAILFFNLQTSLAIATLLWVALYTHCVRKIIVFLCRLVLKRNKMHDREIALWNARMRINVDANLWENEFRITPSSIKRSASYPYTRKREITSPAAFKLLEIDSRFLPKNRLRCRNLRRHSQLQTWWTHIFFFVSPSPFLFFSSRLPCLVVPPLPHQT